MSKLKAIDTLLRVKRRRKEQAEAHVRECVQALAAREQERDAAQRKASECRSAQEAHAAKIDDMCHSGFLPSHLIVMQLMLKDLKAATQQADKGVQAAEQQVVAARQAIAEARRAVQRAQSVVETLEERRRAMQREIENARDELQDEESEEAAVARMLAAGAA